MDVADGEVRAVGVHRYLSRLTCLAIAFGYFETLVHFGDPNKWLEEETRLRSLSNVLKAAGFSEMLYEDFADETFELLRKVATAAQEGNAEDVLLESFGDENSSNYVITHLKVSDELWFAQAFTNYAIDIDCCLDEDTPAGPRAVAARPDSR